MSVRLFVLIGLPLILGLIITVFLTRILCRKQFLEFWQCDPCQCLEKPDVVIKTVEVPVPVPVYVEVEQPANNHNSKS